MKHTRKKQQKPKHRQTRLRYNVSRKNKSFSQKRHNKRIMVGGNITTNGYTPQNKQRWWYSWKYERATQAYNAASKKLSAIKKARDIMWDRVKAIGFNKKENRMIADALDKAVILASEKKKQTEDMVRMLNTQSHNLTTML